MHKHNYRKKWPLIFIRKLFSIRFFSFDFKSISRNIREFRNFSDFSSSESSLGADRIQMTIIKYAFMHFYYEINAMSVIKISLLPRCQHGS